MFMALWLHATFFQKTDLGHGSFVRLGSIKSTRQVTMLMCPEKDGKWRTYLVGHLVFWILHCRHCQQPAVRSSRPLPWKNGRQLLRHLVRFTFVMNRLGYLGPVAPTGMRPDILPKQIHFIRSLAWLSWWGFELDCISTASIQYLARGSPVQRLNLPLMHAVLLILQGRALQRKQLTWVCQMS